MIWEIKNETSEFPKHRDNESTSPEYLRNTFKVRQTRKSIVLNIHVCEKKMKVNKLLNQKRQEKEQQRKEQSNHE